MGPDLLHRVEGDSHRSRKSKWKDARAGNKGKKGPSSSYYVYERGNR